MEILSYLFCVALFLAPFGAGFVLGYLCMDVKCSRLRRENERFRLLMDKMFRLEKLSFQTYSEMFREFYQSQNPQAKPSCPCLKDRTSR
jgi:hypothetical protein